MSRWPGRLITKTPIAPSGASAFDSAPGVWTLPEVAYWTKQGLWPNAANVGDPYFKYVSYLLGTTATNAAQNNTFVDSSTNNFTITRNGNATQGAFSPYAARWSNYFDGAGDYLTMPDNAAYGYGTGDFTIEFWLHPIGSADQTIFSNLTSASSINPHLYYSAGTIRYYTASADRITSGSIALRQWYHVALCRSSGSTRLFINGTQAGSTYSDSNNYGTSAPLGIATYWSGGSPVAANTFAGYISNLRIVKGTAVYTSNFTPPTAPLTAISGTSVLTCQSNRFRDVSANNFAITINGNTAVTAFNPFGQPAPGYSIATYAGSTYLDGSGDYLNSTGGAASAMGSGDFSFEAFVYWTGYPTQYTSIFSTRSTNNANAAAFTVGVESSGYVYAFSSAFIAQTSSGVFALNTWNHVVFTRSGTTARLFVNGVLRATGSNSQNFSDQGFAIGANRDGTEPGAGYISNVRLVKGAIPSDYQTSSTTIGATIFTPPTSPVSAISGTSILCNFANAGIYDASMNSDMETVGNVQVSTAQAKFGSTSIYFDGVGDQLLGQTNPNLAFGTGDFTIEAWVYQTQRNTLSDITSCHNYGVAADWLWSINGSGNLFFQISSSGSGAQTSSSTVPLNTWTHVAVSRQNGVVKQFIAGTEVSSATYATSVANTIRLSIGSASNLNANSTFYGYIDDLRITSGYARYTTNFTPPSSAFFAF